MVFLEYASKIAKLYHRRIFVYGLAIFDSATAYMYKKHPFQTTYQLKDISIIFATFKIS